ncbi:DNA sulfur modification protein DndD [Geminocystis sp. NIES-3709]|uniref:DNA sulfur modification protein DndD n=1 Tax=Geminocystis sp. NIES-3709 TaxID=1617448 RepID=UPI0005FC5162|nr:DNA sulfur modification protein DndD [Geminocystis sp. NIES-3709]BAQ65266.1 DNA sulfur modification protein DndD [Geminocystis sp. NIES-3709]
MITFKELLLENFGPYKGKNKINLVSNNPDNKSPIVLFGAMNGGGKTTLMDAIRLALYGKRSTFSKRENLSYNDYLIQCINNKIDLGEKTRIELTFEHIVNDQWTELKIVRHWDQNVREGNDNLGIIEGEFPDVNLTENWEEYIENFLPLGISNLFLFDGEQVKELAEQDEPTNDVKKAMKSLLGLELATQLITDLDVLINRKQKDIDSKAKEENLANIEAELSQLEKDKNILLEELDLEEKKLKLANKNHNEASKNLRDIGSKIAVEKEKLRAEKQFLETTIEDINIDLIHLATQTTPLGLIPNLLTNLTFQIEKESKLIQIKNSQELWEEKDQKLLDFIQTLDIDNNKFIQIKIFLNKENFLLNNQLENENIYLEAEENTLANLNNIIHNLLPFQQNQVKENIVKLTQLEKQLISIEQKILIVNSPQEYQQLEDKYKQTEKALVKIKSRCETIKKTLTAVEKKINDVRKKLSHYGEDNIKQEQAKHIAELMPKVKQTLSLFQQKLTLRKLNKLESEVTNCFRYLLHKSNFVGKVVISAETFALSLYDNNGLLLSKNRLSAGEKQLLAIALLWGLARVSEKNLPVAIDTPLGRLDSSHRYNLIDRYFPTASHQVILLSTDTEIGEIEVNLLRKKEAITLEYLLDYNSKMNQTTVKSGYFW